MKRTLKFLGVMLIAFVVSLNLVDAKDLTKKVEATSVLGNGLTYDYYYDAEADINEVYISVLVNESNINTVLDQTSGTNAELNIFYFQFDPKMEGKTFKKLGVWAGEGLRTFDEAKTRLDTNLGSETAVDYSTFWINGLSVEYYDGTNWVLSDTKGNGSTSIRTDLVNKLGLTDASELEYGKNFRFSMYDEYSYLWGVEAFDEEDNSLGVEYFHFNWLIEFPVSGKIDDTQVFFTSLNEAVESGSKEITVNEDITVTEDLVIPSDVVVFVADDVTVEVADGVDFEVDGIFVGDVKIDDEVISYSYIFVDDSENGTVLSDKDIAATGEIVTLDIKADEGFVLDAIEVVDDADNKVEVKDGKFTMPAGNVYISATFKEASSVVNPNTSDNIIMFVVLGLFALAVSFIATKKFKKAM